MAVGLWIFACLILAGPCSAQQLWYYVSPYLATKAAVVMRANGTGTPVANVQLSQPSLYGPVSIQAIVSGLVPGTHRVMFHQFGDVSDGRCVNIGPLFNPARTISAGNNFPRPVGDGGIIQANENGLAEINYSDPMITLHGRNSVIGRGLAIHVHGGQVINGGNAFFNVGPTVACGVIGLAGEIP